MRLEPDFYYLGFQRAYGRFLGGGDRLGSLVDQTLRHFEDPDQEQHPSDDIVPTSAAFISLFESLNWAYALDDRLRDEWKPVRVDEREWWQHMEGGELARALDSPGTSFTTIALKRSCCQTARTSREW